jgi:hypothetical protein
LYICAMRHSIAYNGRNYRLHPNQPYFYCSPAKGLTTRALHRQIWMDANGAIPKGYHIHHKDGNPFNNNLSNLESICGRKHTSLHAQEALKTDPERFVRLAAAGRPFAAKWHGSEAGIQWHKQNAANCNFGKREYGEHKCDHCGTCYTKRQSFSRFCSNACKTKHRNRTGVDNEARTCACCSGTFMVNKYAKTKTCSRKCSKTLYWRTRVPA